MGRSHMLRVAALCVAAWAARCALVKKESAVHTYAALRVDAQRW